MQPWFKSTQSPAPVSKYALQFIMMFGWVMLAACSSTPETAPTLTAADVTPTDVPATAAPQAVSATCESVVLTALTLADDACNSTERNQVCYGNSRIEAQLRESDSTFSEPGQRVELAQIESMTLGGLDVESGEWGVALLRIQANLPETIPGQNVVLLIFGNTEFRTVEGDAAAQAFYFQSGITSQPQCKTAPPDGMLVQTPDGATSIEFTVNNVQIELGSTAFLQAAPDDEMVVNVIEGQAVVTADNVTETVPAGARTRIPLDAQGLADGQPSAAEPYDTSNLQALPLSPLERSITIAPPIAGTNSFAPIGFQVQDAISQAGEFDEFTFDAQTGQQVYFSGTADGTDIRWALTAPDGTTVFQNEVVDFDRDTTTFEQSGTYTLRVVSISEATGDYAFQVWDVPQSEATAITIVAGDSEEYTSGSIESPGVIDVYTLDVQAGQAVYFDGEGEETDIRWTLIAPDDTAVFRNEVVQFDRDRTVLEQTGTYTIVVDALNDTLGEYQFRLLDVPDAGTGTVTITAAADIDDAVVTGGTIETPGTQDIFTFEAQAGQMVYFDGIEGDTDIRWTLIAPDGTPLFQNEVVAFDQDVFALEQTGTHTLTIDALNDSTGNYQFRLLEVPTSESQSVSIGPSLEASMTRGAIETPGVIDIYTFEGETGQAVYFDGEGEETDIRWTLTAPDETIVFQNEVVEFDYNVLVLEQAGTYTLTVDAFNDSIGEYGFRLLNVPAVQRVPVTITASGAASGAANGMIEGALEIPGSTAEYTFEGRQGQVLFFDGEADDTNFRWTLTAPDGAMVFQNEVVLFDVENVTLEQTGTYLLTVDGLEDAIGPYSFQIQE